MFLGQSETAPFGDILFISIHVNFRNFTTREIDLRLFLWKLCVPGRIDIVLLNREL